MARAFALTTPNGETMNFLKEAGQEKFEKMNEAYAKALETAVCEFPNHGQIIEALVKYPQNPEKILETCRIQPGIPVKP